MPYYGAGDYYRGDGNYAAGGISLKGIIKGVGKAVVSVAKATPIGRAVSTIVEASKPRVPIVQGFAPPPIPVTPVPGIGGAIDRLLPGGSTGYEVVPPGPMGRRPGDTGRIGHFKKDGEWTNRARPRMNVTNVRALRKAGRRVRGFLKVAARLGALPVSRSGKGKLFKRKKR